MRTILDLCGGTGAWSEPYRQAGYDVQLVTLPDDIRLLHYPGAVHGILAAPPCTVFACSGNRWKRTEADYLAALSVVDACLRLVTLCRPAWWCLENPVGTLGRWLGKPVLSFQPSDYGDPWHKRTCLWGSFTTPTRAPVEAHRSCEQGGWTQQLGGKSERTKQLRSVTPPGFARAFHAANP